MISNEKGTVHINNCCNETSVNLKENTHHKINKKGTKLMSRNNRLRWLTHLFAVIEFTQYIRIIEGAFFMTQPEQLNTFNLCLVFLRKTDFYDLSVAKSQRRVSHISWNRFIWFSIFFIQMHNLKVNYLKK